MAWIVAAVIFAGALALLPLTLGRFRKSARGGRFAGVALGLGFVFAHLFDPAKAAATEEIAKRTEAGAPEKAWGGEKF